MVNSNLFSEETIISFLTTRNEDGRTGFMLACMENHQEVVKVMLECPVSKKLISEKSSGLDFVNFKDKKGKTGFILACAHGNHSVIEFMVNSDLFSEETIISFLTTRNEDGKTGFMLACM